MRLHRDLGFLRWWPGWSGCLILIVDFNRGGKGVYPNCRFSIFYFFLVLRLDKDLGFSPGWSVRSWWFFIIVDSKRGQKGVLTICRFSNFGVLFYFIFYFFLVLGLDRDLGFSSGWSAWSELFLLIIDFKSGGKGFPTICRFWKFLILFLFFGS